MVIGHRKTSTHGLGLEPKNMGRICDSGYSGYREARWGLMASWETAFYQVGARSPTLELVGEPAGCHDDHLPGQHSPVVTHGVGTVGAQ